jgi:hypothetical protein
LEAEEIEMIAEIWVAAAEVAMEAVATLFVSVHSGAAIAIVMTATGHSVTYVFSFLA